MQMPRKLPRDLNSRAAQIAVLSTGQPLPNLSGRVSTLEPAPAPVREKNPAAVALGRLGGLKGGKVRAESLSESRRAQIAKLAARKRWGSK